MQSSYRILRIFGISVELHITFILFFFFILLILGVSTFVFWVLLFAVVLMHELSHSVVALKFGIKVPKITLIPIGGLASIEVPEDPRKELLISIAGPLSNFLLAMICFVVLFCTSSHLYSYMELIQQLETGVANILNLSYILSGAIWINLILGLFNLLPGFPMDGGRVFRASLAFWIDYIKATKLAVQIGQFLAIIMILVGILPLDIKIFGLSISPNLWLTIIGIFIFFAGGQELRVVRLKHALRDMTIGSVAIRNLRYVNESTSIKEFLDMIAIPEQDHYPVTDYSGRLIGILNIEDLKEIDQRDFDKIPVRNLTRRRFDIVDANLKIEEKIATLLTKDFVLVVDAGKVVGYLTPGHLLEIARFYGIRKRG